MGGGKAAASLKESRDTIVISASCDRECVKLTEGRLGKDKGTGSKSRDRRGGRVLFSEGSWVFFPSDPLCHCTVLVVPQFKHVRTSFARVGGSMGGGKATGSLKESRDTTIVSASLIVNALN